MTSRTRFWVMGVLVFALAAASVGMAAPGALGAGFEVESFFAANCNASSEACNKAASPAEEKKKAEEEGYSQAAGHPPFGVTDFTIPSAEIQKVPFTAFAPEGNVKSLRIDVAPGVSTNPQAVPKCAVTEAGFLGTELEPAPGLHAFTAPKCPGSEIGTNTVHVVVEVASHVYENFVFKGAVYNLEQPEGFSSYFGVALNLEPLLGVPLYAHTFIEGHVEWGKQENGTQAGDYHDYFEIKNITPGLIESRLAFKGDIGTGGFLSNPSSCLGPGPQTTTRLHVETYEGASATTRYTTPIGTEGCNGLAPFALVPFAPTFSLTPETKQSDQPDGVTTNLTLPHDPNPAHLDSSQLKSATVILPEGMTLNPAAAQGLEACTPAQARIHSPVAGVACPAKSEIGTVTLNVPGLPPESLKGSLYLGGPESGPITDPPYTVYLDAESARYGVSTRLMGEVRPDASTGRVTAVFAENPEQPFSEAILRFKGGALAPIANPLVCGPALTETSLVPYTGTPTQKPNSEFVVGSGQSGGTCASPLPFALTQATEAHPAGGAEATNFTLNLARADGQQYLSNVHAVLPEGLVGKIPVVPLCPEPAASTGNCPASSQIGKVAATVGSGPTPVRFEGPVYLTGPTEGAPYGMTMVVNAEVGPFSLGNVIARTKIEVTPYSGRVVVSGKVPTIFKGIPLRLKSLAVTINRQGFLINPTNCGPLRTETGLSAQQGGSQNIATPFQATGCSKLAFKPKFGASTSGKASRANGTSIVTKLNFQPKGLEANVKSVVVSLPKALPSRLSTLNHACTEAVFNANPGKCPSNSKVGTARVKTPTLPGQLSGPAYFVSHGGAKFPDLDLVLSGNGITVILVGNTNINEKTNVTTTSFLAPPDVPFTGFELNLPAGPNSAVGANGNLCKQSLVMPTTITAQNGKVIKQNTKMAVSGCPVQVLSAYTHDRQAVITVRAPAAGRVSGSGAHLGTRYKHPGEAQKVTLRLPLTKAVGHQPISVRIGFLPKNKKEHSSVAHVTVVF